MNRLAAIACAVIGTTATVQGMDNAQSASSVYRRLLLDIRVEGLEHSLMRCFYRIRDGHNGSSAAVKQSLIKLAQEGQSPEARAYARAVLDALPS
ncbi:MAG: hypothetical protein QG604_957 [Candidatus Dependentiae bacterium]|nr:hypothetical protein [Candidatus Dependentiae bacterium]